MFFGSNKDEKPNIIYGLKFEICLRIFNIGD